MSVASANKDQMKVWKSAAKPDKDGPDRPTTRVMLTIRKDEKESGYFAKLYASDGYQLVSRNIQAESDASGEAPLEVAIPRDAMEAAEKAMHKTDLAYFDDNKITVRAVIEDSDTHEAHTVVRAVIPYVEQIDMFSDFLSVVEKHANSEIPERIVTLDAKVLKKVVEQLKSGDARVFVKLHLREGGIEPLILTAFPGIPDEEITAVVMPIKE